MPITFRPAKRENTPLIIGLTGPTKSGKTLSALRLATGIANGGVIAMINAEGRRGHQYAEFFKYLTYDIEPPYNPGRFTEALLKMKELKPAVAIVDSASHMHDGPGGLLEFHDAEAERMSGGDFKKRERVTFAAWIKPKAEENKFIYTMLDMNCSIILCFRAKEKIKIVKGKEPIDLGWQPIAGDRITFETIFTLTLPPHCKGVPDLETSFLRKPFDDMIPANQTIDEELGKALRKWAAGGAPSETKKPSVEIPAEIIDEGVVVSTSISEAPLGDGVVVVEYKATDKAFLDVGEMLAARKQEIGQLYFKISDKKGQQNFQDILKQFDYASSADVDNLEAADEILTQLKGAMK